jgi:hypothetical protein
MVSTSFIALQDERFKKMEYKHTMLNSILKKRLRDVCELVLFALYDPITTYSRFSFGSASYLVFVSSFSNVDTNLQTCLSTTGTTEPSEQRSDYFCTLPCPL